MSEWPICSDRVRVLRVIGRLNVGGPAIHATLLTRRLEACGYDTMLVAGVAGATEGRYLDLHVFLDFDLAGKAPIFLGFAAGNV